MTIYTRVDHRLVIKNTLIKASKIPMPNTGTQLPYDQSEAAELCKTARNQHKVTYLRRQLTHKHKRSVDERKTHTRLFKTASLATWVKCLHQGWLIDSQSRDAEPVYTDIITLK